MPTAPYFNKAGVRVCGTTTPIGRFKDSGALIQWAYKTGIEHGTLIGQGRPAPGGLYEITDKACEIGTIAHALVEAHIKRQPLSDDYLTNIDHHSLNLARNAFGSYLEWESGTKVEIIETEMHLVSELYQYGGTPDAIGTINGKPVLLDWKTSNAVYGDHLIQLAAYSNLIHECRGVKVEGYHLCRFSKENGDFAHHYYGDLSDEWESFKLILKLYELDKKIKKRAR